MNFITFTDCEGFQRTMISATVPRKGSIVRFFHEERVRAFKVRDIVHNYTDFGPDVERGMQAMNRDVDVYLTPFDFVNA